MSEKRVDDLLGLFADAETILDDCEEAEQDKKIKTHLANMLCSLNDIIVQTEKLQEMKGANHDPR